MPLDTVRVPDEILSCSSCGFQTMAKASEPGWVGAQWIEGNSLYWYCPKGACQERYQVDLAEWQRSMGYEPTEDEFDV